LESMHPIRLDRFEEHGRLIDTIETETDHTPGGVVEDVETHLRDRNIEG